MIKTISIIFIGWYDSEGSTAETNSLTQAGGQAGNYGANEKSFGECKKENFGMNSDKPEYYSNTAWITLIPKDKVLLKKYQRFQIPFSKSPRSQSVSFL